MSDGKSRRSGLGCGFALLIVASFAFMVYVMMEQSGDAPYQAMDTINLHAGPDEAEPVVATLPREAVLMCHGVVEADRRWLDCSDMLETKYVLAASMQPIDEETYETFRRARNAPRPLSY